MGDDGAGRGMGAVVSRDALIYLERGVAHLDPRAIVEVGHGFVGVRRAAMAVRMPLDARVGWAGEDGETAWESLPDVVLAAARRQGMKVGLYRPRMKRRGLGRKLALRFALQMEESS